MGIRLHREHGLNPTVSTCLFCGEAKNEVVLLGAKYRGAAPPQMVVNAEPCDACKEQFAQGITLFGVADHKPGLTMPLNREGLLYGKGLTGTFAVVSDGFFDRVLAPGMRDDLAEVVRTSRKAFVDDAEVRGLIAASGSGS